VSVISDLAESRHLLLGYFTIPILSLMAISVIFGIKSELTLAHSDKVLKVDIQMVTKPMIFLYNNILMFYALTQLLTVRSIFLLESVSMRGPGFSHILMI